MSEQNLNATEHWCATVGQLRRALADVPDDAVLCPYSDDDSLVQRLLVARFWSWEGDWDRVHLIFRAQVDTAPGISDPPADPLGELNEDDMDLWVFLSSVVDPRSGATCSYSYDELKQALNFSRNRVIRSRDRLVDRGLIAVVHGTGRKPSEYRVLQSPPTGYFHG